MPLDWLFERFRRHAREDAIVWQDEICSYGRLLESVTSAADLLESEQIGRGTPIMVNADYSPGAIALMLAAAARGGVVVPVASHVVADRPKLARITQCHACIDVPDGLTYRLTRLDHQVDHPLLLHLTRNCRPGLVLFSSGSTGEPKATLHDLEALLGRFKTERHTQRIATFLLFDHIGGFNTLMYALSNHGCLITLPARDPETVCRTIARHRVEVLPTSPTFLNLLLMSGALDRHDLSSLKLINYATEVMPQATLDRLNKALPGVVFHQSYGLSEVGIMRTKSRARDSVWLSVEGATQVRVVDGILQIKAPSAMLGYLNAPSPFTDDGWFNTQDEVEADGQWFRIKGRQTDIINVGGEKVYPAEVEAVIMEVDNIADVTVASEPHPFTGRIVVAEVTTRADEDLKEVARRVRAHCFRRLASFKVPVKVIRTADRRITERFKKERRMKLDA
jgi:long-chain acyl-CoA synthetase